MRHRPLALRLRSSSPAAEQRLYAALGLPSCPTRGTTDDTLEALVGLHRELARRAREAIATPEEARRANNEIRQHMRGENNYMPESRSSRRSP